MLRRTTLLAFTLLAITLLADAQFESLGAARKEKKAAAAAAKETPAPTPAPAPPAEKKAAATPAPTKAAPPPPEPEDDPADKVIPEDTAKATGKPKSDVTYTIAAKRGAFEPRTKTLTLEGVPTYVGATKISDDGTRAVRRHKTATIMGKDFRALWGGDDKTSQAGIFASVGNRDDISLIVNLSEPRYNQNSGTLTFTATQVAPIEGAATQGGVAEQLIQETAKSGSWLRAVSRVNMADPVLVIDGQSASS